MARKHPPQQSFDYPQDDEHMNNKHPDPISDDIHAMVVAAAIFIIVVILAVVTWLVYG